MQQKVFLQPLGCSLRDFKLYYGINYLTLIITVNKTSTLLSNLPTFLDSLAKLVLENQIALNYMLAEKGDV